MKIYTVIQYYVFWNYINQNEVKSFTTFEAAEQYYYQFDKAELIESVLNTNHSYDNGAGFQGNTPTDGLSGFRG